MQILGLLGMYFDAVVVEVEKYLLFFRWSLAILCLLTYIGHVAIKCLAALNLPTEFLIDLVP